MASRRAVPKRPASRAAAPPPPAESSSSDESEDEEAMAQASIPAPTPAVKNAPAPPQKGDDSESSEEEGDDDDDDYEGEEEDQPAHAAPKNQPTPPQNEEDSETSGSEDDEDEEGPTGAAPPSAPKKQPPQPEKSEDSDTSGDEEEAPPKPAPVKEASASASALKPPASAAAATEAKKPGAFNRIWSMDDEVRILEAVAAHQKQHGAFPQPEALINVLAGKLDHPAYGNRELQSKLGTLKRRYRTLRKKGEVPSNEHDRRILDLSKIIWEGGKTATAATNNGHDQKGFEEMCELYPYLAEEVKVLEAAYPGMCKRKFEKMDDDKARAMDEKIKKQRLVQIRVEMRRADLTKKVTKALMDLIDG